MSRIGKLLLSVVLLAAAGGAGYCLYLALSEDSVKEAGRLMYLKDRARRENAREIAKKEAIAEVLAHGRKASVKTRRKAEDVIEAKLDEMKLKGVSRLRMKGWLIRAKSASAVAPDMPNNKFSAEEQELLEAADEAVSEKDLIMARLVAEDALKSEDPRIRLRAVETLTEFGEAGLVELADFLTDSHPDVANLAADRFELGLQEMENEQEQVTMARLGLLTINDEDQLRSLAGTLTMAVDKFLVLDALAQVIVDGTETQSAIAREYYESETGEEWQGVDAADRWLQENYEPPEPEETEEAEPPAEEEFQEEEGSY